MINYQLNFMLEKGKKLKVIFVLFLLSFSTIMADNLSSKLEKENPIEHINTMKPQEIEKVKIKLTKILKNVKLYKKNNENKTQQLLAKLETMKREFSQYKIKKEREIKKVKSKLYLTKKKLSKTQKKLAYIKKKKVKKSTHKKVVRKKKVLQKKPIIKKVLHKKAINKRKAIPKKKVIKKLANKRVIKKRVIKKDITPKKSRPQIKKAEIKVVKYIEPLPKVNDLPWVEIVVENGVDIYQLALKYYGDKKEYKKIYAANRRTIQNNFRIEDGMELKIPMTEQFEEQPMVLNMD